MKVIKTVLIAVLLFGACTGQARKKHMCAQAKSACAQISDDTPKRCALKPRTRRNNCPPPEYGLDCDSCCYQSYRTPGYFPNAFRPYYGDGYFGRRPGNFNFAW
ncbi:MAG: hypothetical protein AB7F19_07215 [Candidatus Babeliales bacterium]